MWVGFLFLPQGTPDNAVIIGLCFMVLTSGLRNAQMNYAPDGDNLILVFVERDKGTSTVCASPKIHLLWIITQLKKLMWLIFNFPPADTLNNYWIIRGAPNGFSSVGISLLLPLLYSISSILRGKLFLRLVLSNNSLTIFLSITNNITRNPCVNK